MNKNFPKSAPVRWALLCCLLLVAAALAACGGAAEPAMSDMSEMDEMDHDQMESDEHGHGDDDHGHSDGAVERVPNNGAVIRITSPADGATFSAGEQVIVEVEFENFTPGEDGNHWHVYVDGASWGMVMGGNVDQPLTGLEPGEHEISVFMSIETHEEMEDGDAITITVTE